ncbi:hypothetical protein IGB42_01584 [Andreprevotia sp. IGB-42]|uniref:hypothetical protein n=1 Tax=Andreprevotia sp. IGB-42 TaxID=2497473 RepID=UPI001356BB95|nr:hypothetical protein [Andreprevotia sp. IGB-42]KAF0813905.1 hypothetical protein IGB42_01584 [Andreprevotia sp. IGB-42]
MNGSKLHDQLEHALIAKARELAVRFKGKPMCRFDISVFPWHGTLALSVLLAEDTCDERDIAAWPHYNVSQFSEGKWPEAADFCSEMQRLWHGDRQLTTSLLALVGEVVRAQSVRSAFGSFDRAEDFVLTVLDPDDEHSLNYASQT